MKLSNPFVILFIFLFIHTNIPLKTKDLSPKSDRGKYWQWPQSRPQSKPQSKPQNKFMIHAYLTELFQYNPVTTEYAAYKLLKEYPLKKNVNYLAMPWWFLIDKKKLKLVPHIRLNGGFTICQNKGYEQILDMIDEMGLDTLFATHAKENQVYKGIKILPFPHFAVNGVPPARHKDILYSFVGFENAQPVRRAIFQMPIFENCIVIERYQRHFRSQTTERLEYQDILARSRYSLCPRGKGPNTIRFWESLQTGAIPVLLADDMTLSEGINWDECIVRIPEKDVLKINMIIPSIPQEKEQKMRENCLKAYTLFSGKNLVSCIRRYYEKSQ